MSYVNLLAGKLVCEREHKVGCAEVEDKAEGDGDGQSRKGLLEDGQEDER